MSLIDASLAIGFLGTSNRLAIFGNNYLEVLEAAGLGVAHLVKINTFLTDRSQVVANRAVRRKMLGGHEPASTVMIAETVDEKWLLEIEAIAAE